MDTYHLNFFRSERIYKIDRNSASFNNNKVERAFDKSITEKIKATSQNNLIVQMAFIIYNLSNFWGANDWFGSLLQVVLVFEVICVCVLWVRLGKNQKYKPTDGFIHFLRYYLLISTLFH